MKTLFILLYIVSIINVSAQNKWLKLNGPPGGTISGLIAKGDTIIAGTGLNKALIFYSTNRGETWDKAEFKNSYLSLGDQSRINRFIFSNDGGIIASAGRNGLYKSFDLKHWNSILFNQEDYWGLGKDINGVLYAGGAYGSIYRSLNNGLTWDAMNSGTTDPIVTFLLARDSSMLAGSYMKILKKKYTSDSWEAIAFQDQNNLNNLFNDSSNNVYANSSSYIYKSTDAGDSWRIISNSSFFYGNYIYDCIFNKQLIAAMGDETGWFGNGWGAALSDDYGLTWRWSIIGLPPKFASSFRLAKSNNDTYVSTIAAGMFKSTNFGESWNSINNGIWAANTLDITFDNEGNLYCTCWSDGIFKSTDKGVTWKEINSGLTNVYLYSIVVDNNGYLISGTDQGIFRSTDKGENWTLTGSAGNNYAYRLYKDKYNRIYAINYGDGIYRTSDLGVSWSKIDDGFGSQFVFGFTIDLNDNIYAGTRGGNIYRSTNDGVSWSLMRSSNIYNCVIDRIVIATNGDIFATNTEEGVIRSSDNGTTWSVINNGLRSLKVSALAVNSKGELFVSTNDDLFYFSSDNGNNWTYIVSNLDKITIAHIIFDNNYNVFLATDESVWRSNPDSQVSVKDKSPTIHQYSLNQNYPNPFNSNTTINYSVKYACLVKMEIYDILGRKVESLVNEEKQSGNYSITFNANSITSGVYFYKLEAGGFTSIKKMLLLK